MKNLLIKLGLWEEIEEYIEITEQEKQLFLEAKKHYCERCNRWFEKHSGLRMHNFHHEKAGNQSSL